MPNRILRSWTDSEKFDGLSAEAERMFTRLLMVVDDFGRYHADLRLIGAGCFPLVKNLRGTEVAAWLKELSDRRLLLTYEATGRSYLAIINFRQRLKQSVPKFPPKPGEDPYWLPDEGKPPDIPGISGNFPEGQYTSPSPSPPRGGSAEGGAEANGSEGREMRLFTDLWQAEYQAVNGRKYLHQGAKDAQAVKRLLKSGRTLGQLIETARGAWKRPDLFNCRQAAAIASFASRLNHIEQELAGPSVAAKPGQLAGVDKSILSKELERVVEDLRREVDSVATDAAGTKHWSQKQRDRVKALRAKRDEIRKKLGIC